MKRLFSLLIVAMFVFSAGCAGISKVAYDRFDRGRKIIRVAVIAYNQTIADRYKMWAWTKEKPRVVPPDTFAKGITKSLSAKTDYHVISQEVVQNAIKKLKLENKETLSPSEVRAFSRLTGADAILFANVSLYAQNYLFYKTFGLVGIDMRLVGTADDSLLWEASGKNFALFISTDKALSKLEEKMLVQVAKKLAKDKTTAL